MIIKDVNVNKLHDEFIRAGIQPWPVFEDDNGDGNFTFPEDTDMELVQQIISAHDPSPTPPPPSNRERLEVLEQAMLDLILGGE